MLDLLFIGGIYLKEFKKEIESKIIDQPQYAANNFQWLLIDGFDKNPYVKVRILNEMFIGSYPKHYTDAIVKESRFSHKVGADDINLGFLNISIIKQFVPSFREKKYIKLWANEKVEDVNKAVFLYSMNPRFVRQVRLIKKYNKSIVICISINDIYEFTMNFNKKQIIKNLWKYIQKNRMQKAQKNVDCYMLVTKQMAEYLKLHANQYVVVESLIASDRYIPQVACPIDNGTIYVVYTGGLDRKYGIMNLIHAFMNIDDPNYRLIICGDGKSKDDIIQCEQSDKRIVFLGSVTPEKAREIQNQATILVNPRQNTHTFTSLSFPHKTMEYLLAKKPVVCYKLSGIPDEYDEYLIYVENNTIETLSKTILQICSLPQNERESIGMKNNEFVLKYKNTFVQTTKIIELINKHIKIKQKS